MFLPTLSPLKYTIKMLSTITIRVKVKFLHFYTLTENSKYATRS